MGRQPSLQKRLTVSVSAALGEQIHVTCRSGVVLAEMPGVGYGGREIGEIMDDEVNEPGYAGAGALSAARAYICVRVRQ